MKGSVKLFMASIIVLAIAIGFFLGAFMNKPACHKAGQPGMGPAAEFPMPPPPPGMKPGQFPPPGMKPGNMSSPMGDGPVPKMKGAKMHGPTPEMMDSLLQITPEQKTALEANRKSMDSTGKALREQKMNAEKALKEAIDKNDNAAIASARKQILSAQEALLDHRINGVAELNKILTKEQQQKFRDIISAEFKGPKGHGGDFKGPMEQGAEFKGPKGHGGDFKGPMEQGAEFKGPKGHGGDFKGPMGQGAEFKGPKGHGGDFKEPMGQGAEFKGPKGHGGDFKGPKGPGGNPPPPPQN